MASLLSRMWSESEKAMTKKGDSQLRELMAAHPDMPLIAKCPALPSDYDHYWLDVCGASIDTILKPDDVKRKYGDCYGLNDENYYWDEDDAIEDVAECLFECWFDFALKHGMPYEYKDIPYDALKKFCGAESDMDDFAEDVATRIVEDMPWQDCIVIDCW